MMVMSSVLSRVKWSVVTVALILTAVAVPSLAQAEMNVAFLWHQHQPLYTDPATGNPTLPWVRMHAIKDYYDMVAILQEYPGLRATFNLVPSLLDQLEAYTTGSVVDTYQEVALVRAEHLTDDQKEFLLRRFFDANWEKVIGRFPRYKELLELRGTGASDLEIADAMTRFTAQDYRDLQVWFDLAWFDPDFLEGDPELAALVRKGRYFSEQDKAVIHEKQLQIMREVVHLHRTMQASGQIEVITTPYAHPILPLLYDVELAREASPSLDLPLERFAFPQDIARHLDLALEHFRRNFGRDPRGLWPSEQAVSKYILPQVAQAGFEWMVSSEGVLSKSLGVQLRGISGEVVRPDLLYQPYWAEWEGERVAILFRDIVLSDRVGFEYSGMSGAAAALDLIGYLHRVRERLGDAASEKVVLIALDGENAWEHYENDGKAFFHALYSRLEKDPYLRTVTVSEYLDRHPPTAVLSDLWSGSWISDNLETWIGETEENTAWSQLALAREALSEFEEAHGNDPAYAEHIAAAWRSMIAAQGSDWFWWYGADQDSGNDEAFDALFRSHLRGVYEAMGQEPPTRLYQPIVAPRPAQTFRTVSGLSTPMPDGWADAGEWDRAAEYRALTDKAPWGDVRVLDALYLAVDNQQLTVRVNFADVQARALVGESLQLMLYLDHPSHGQVNETTRYSRMGHDATYLGYPSVYEVLLDFAIAPRGVRPTPVVSRAEGEGVWREALSLRQAGLGSVFEVRIPFEELGYGPGDPVRLTAVVAKNGVDIDRLPDDGPAVVYVPRATEGRLVFSADDPEGDDYGPGTYTYPTNEVFVPGVFDLTRFEVYETETDVVFHVQFAGPIENVWGSPIGLSVQTVDIYLDTDGVEGSGSTEALAGRRVQISPDSAWEYAIWVEGWNQKLFTADGSELGVAVRAVTDPINRRLTIQVPKSAIGDPSDDWRYLVLVMGQEGFPASDSLRVREVTRLAQEWRFGGGHDGTFDPNVIDMLAPAGEQERMLERYSVEEGRLATISAYVPME